jgi:hypothetical protein
MSKDRLEQGRRRIAERRRDVEGRLDAVRSAIADETGRAPTSRGLITLLIAATAGLALALRGRARKEGRLPTAQE